eukprot:TRINITY_DN16719_c0_g1_i2.p1 TRINITY_DN16719_c0_g1~~TRINITY_DN16719_c0_g1_i2.p1  ORF type:complete len:316 (-),score=12.30 TRINITY_DN16719_c0_g1_i2:265-1212(-)
MLPMNPRHYRHVDEKHGWAVPLEVRQQGGANYFEPKIACLPKPQFFAPSNSILETLPHRRPYLGARRDETPPQRVRHNLPPVQRGLPVKSQTARTYRMPRMLSMRPAEYLAAKKWTQPEELTRVGDAALFQPQPPLRRRSVRNSLDLAGHPQDAVAMPHPSLAAHPMSRTMPEPRRSSTHTVPEPRHALLQPQSMLHSMRPFDYARPIIGTPAAPQSLQSTHRSERSRGSIASNMTWRSSHNFDTYAEHVRGEGAPRVNARIPPPAVYGVEPGQGSEQGSDVQDLASKQSDSGDQDNREAQRDWFEPQGPQARRQ